MSKLVSHHTTISKDQPKLTCNDYDVLEESSANDYEETLHTYANIPGTPDYSNVSGYDEANSSNTPTNDDEERYLDPGHSEADMCTCFKQKCCLIKESEIR